MHVFVTPKDVWFDEVQFEAQEANVGIDDHRKSKFFIQVKHFVWPLPLCLFLNLTLTFQIKQVGH